eukprot:IDg10730t1
MKKCASVLQRHGIEKVEEFMLDKKGAMGCVKRAGLPKSVSSELERFANSIPEVAIDESVLEERDGSLYVRVMAKAVWSSEIGRRIRGHSAYGTPQWFMLVSDVSGERIFAARPVELLDSERYQSIDAKLSEKVDANNLKIKFSLARFQAGAFIEAVKPGGPHLWRPARVVKHCTDHYNVSFTGDRTHYKVLLENVRERTITSHPEKSRVSSPFVTEVVDLTLDDSDIMLRNHSVSSHATPIARPVQSRHYAPHDPYLTEQYSSPNNLSRISHGFFYDPHMPPLSPTVPLPDDRFDNRHFEDNRLPFWLSNQRMNHQRQYYRRRFDSGYGLPLPQPF